ncbi:hypothetical protein HispidOSU_010551, partial [Sigmodon hispidus]
RCIDTMGRCEVQGPPTHVVKTVALSTPTKRISIEGGEFPIVSEFLSSISQ